MPTKIKTVNLGRGKAGAGSVGYRLINTGGSVTTARTQVGISEIGSGIFFANVAFPAAWAQGIILWDDGRTPRFYGQENYDADVADIGSQIWSKNPNNYNAADTFGHRINLLVKRAGAGGGGGMIVTQTFSQKDKDKLFEGIEDLQKRLKAVENLSSRMSVNMKTETQVTMERFSKSFSELQKANKEIVLASKVESQSINEGLRKDVNLAIDYLVKVVKLRNTVDKIHEVLLEQKDEFTKIQRLEGATQTLINDPKRKDEIIALSILMTESINQAKEIKDKIAKVINMENTRLEESKLTDKAILQMLEPGQIKNLLEVAK